jgi:hypothetical protein
MAGAAGSPSITGGVAALGMSMYGDLLDNDVSAGEMWKNAGLDHGNCFCNAVSLVSSLKGVSKREKYSESLCIMMLKGTLDTAVGIDWERPWIKILLGKWRIIVRWLLWLSSWLELPEELLVGTLHELLQQKQEWPMKN